MRKSCSSNNTAKGSILLKEAFSIDNTAISKAKSERIDKQYYTDFEVSKEEAVKSIQIAEEFIAEMNNFIATFNEEKIRQYHHKAVSLFTGESSKKEGINPK